MKKKLFKVYGLDMEYEFNIYKNVGNNYCVGGDRTNLVNRNRNDHKWYNTYSEWKIHVTEILPKGFNNYDDMMHWLYLGKRNAEHRLDAIKAVLIPFYIVLLDVIDIINPFVFDEYETAYSVAMFNRKGEFFFSIFILTIVMLTSTIILATAGRRVDFYKDFISIAEEEKEYNQK